MCSAPRKTPTAAASSGAYPAAGFPPSRAGIGPGQELINRGYTVFEVVHGSQPKFTIPEVLEDMHRAVRYIKAHAQEYHG